MKNSGTFSCVLMSKYYLSRTVETELKQPLGQQSQEHPPHYPARMETEQLPAAAKEQSNAPARAVSEQSAIPAALFLPPLMIRFPANRQNELLERQEQLGLLTEHPSSQSGGAELLEMTIQW